MTYWRGMRAAVFALQSESSVFTADPCCDDADKEVVKLYGQEAAADYGLGVVAPPTIATKHSSDEVWVVRFHIKDRGSVVLNLRQTGEILANKDTPVWMASGTATSRNSVSYRHETQAMHNLGNFTMYQDYSHRAAFVVFHKNNAIRGYVGFHELKFRKKRKFTTGQGNSPPQYFLIKSTGSPNYPGSGFPVVTTFRNVPRPGGLPAVVYPELLIVVDWKYVEMNGAKVLRSLLVYWNCVDMLFSAVTVPKIRLNIAGIIIPQNEYATPWIEKAKIPGTEAVSVDYILEMTNTHFASYSREFPAGSFDVLVVLISAPMKSESDQLQYAGYAHADAPCAFSNIPTAAVYSKAPYSTGAHELSHIFSAGHDETMTNCTKTSGIMSFSVTTDAANLFWSQCSLKSISNYFSNKRSLCFDNCPTSVLQCQTTPTFHDNLPTYLCGKAALAVCGDSGFEAFRQGTCAGYLECANLTNSQVYLISTPDGTICEWTFSGSEKPTKVCWRGSCVPYDSGRGYC